MNKRRKILLISNNFPNPAEPNRGIFKLQLVKELQKIADVVVVSPLPWFAKWLDFGLFRNWRHFARIPRTYEIEGVTVRSPKYLYVPRLFEPLHSIAMFVRILPELLSIRRDFQFEIIKTHWLYPDGVSSSWCAGLLKTPIILCAQGCDVNQFLTERSKRIQILPTLKSASHVVTVSNELTEKLIEWRVPESRISTILNGVNKRYFFQDEQASPKQCNKTVRKILFVGRLSEEKDVRILLEAVALLSRIRQDFHVDIVGDGPERASLEDYSKSNGLVDTVSFIGQVYHRQVSGYLRQCDVFCLPSKREGCPNVLLEALASGVPVVAFRVGAIPDIVTINTGIVVEGRAASGLMNALHQALDSSWNKAEIAESVKELTWERAAARYLKIVEQVLT